MKRNFLCFISLITILTIAESRGMTSKLYRHDDKNSNYKGQLSTLLLLL
jgi:hypothetical protein